MLNEVGYKKKFELATLTVRLRDTNFISRKIKTKIKMLMRIKKRTNF